MLNNIDEINYYAKEVINRNLSKRQLNEIIKNKEYERLPIKTKNKLKEEKELNINDLAPNPILIKNKENIEIVSEKILHKLI